MVAKAGSSEVGKRGSQAIARAQQRRRRPNIHGPKHTIEVVLSEEEWEKVSAAAAEVDVTVPWYLVKSALVPVPVAAVESSGKSSEKPGKPWLPWPKRQMLAGLLMSATGALDEIRLQHLAKIGGNLNQLAHAANITGFLKEETAEVLVELRELIAEVRERTERIEELAQQVARR